MAGPPYGSCATSKKRGKNELFPFLIFSLITLGMCPLITLFTLRVNYGDIIYSVVVTVE